MKQKMTPTLIQLLLIVTVVILMLLSLFLQVNTIYTNQAGRVAYRVVASPDSDPVQGYTFWLQVAAHAWQPRHYNTTTMQWQTRRSDP